MFGNITTNVGSANDKNPSTMPSSIFGQPKVSFTPFSGGFGGDTASNNPLVPPTPTPFVFRTQQTQNPFQTNPPTMGAPQYAPLSTPGMMPSMAFQYPVTTPTISAPQLSQKDPSQHVQHPLILLEFLQVSYDPASPHCRFRHVFYNKAESGPVTQSSVQKPSYIDDALWQQAWSDRTEQDMIPVIASSFDELEARMELQNERATHYQQKCKELSGRVAELLRKQSMESLVKIKAILQSFHSLSLQILRLIKYIEIIRKHGQWKSRSEQQFLNIMTKQRQLVSSLIPAYQQIREKVALLSRSPSFISSSMNRMDPQILRDIPIVDLLEEQHKELKCLVEQCGQLLLKVDSIGS